MLWRMHAQRLLVEKGDKSVVPALIALAADPSVDAIGLNPAAVHALWTLHGLGAFGGEQPTPTAVAAAEQALKHPSASRAQGRAGRAAADGRSRSRRSWPPRSLEDPDAQVRKSALLALSEMPAQRRRRGGGLRHPLAQGERRRPLDRRRRRHRRLAARRRVPQGRLRRPPGLDDAARRAERASRRAAPPRTPRPTCLPNPSFEEVAGGKPKGWQVRHYSGEAVQDLGSPGRTGNTCLRLHSDTGADTSWYADVPSPRTPTTACPRWIKTEKRRPRSATAWRAAQRPRHRVQDQGRSPAPTTGSAVEVDFNSGDSRAVSINCLFGGWGHAKGTAWYDDLELVPHRRAPAAACRGRGAR